MHGDTTMYYKLSSLKGKKMFNELLNIKLFVNLISYCMYITHEVLSVRPCIDISCKISFRHVDLWFHQTLLHVFSKLTYCHTSLILLNHLRDNCCSWTGWVKQTASDIILTYELFYVCIRFRLLKWFGLRVTEETLVVEILV